MNDIDWLETLSTEDVLANPLQQTLGAIVPFFEDKEEGSSARCAEFMFKALQEKGGSAGRFDTRERARRHRTGQHNGLPSDSFVRDSWIRPPGPCPSGLPFDHDVLEQQRRHDELHLAQARILAEADHWVDGSYFVVLDESPNRGSGKLYHDSEKAPLQAFEETGIMANPVFRRHGKAGQAAPHFRGSTGGIEPLHMAAFGLENGAAATLHIDFLSKISKRLKKDVNGEFFGLLPATERCMDQLARMDVAPRFILGDKGIVGKGAVWECLRDYADPRGIFVVGPARRGPNMQLIMEQVYKDGLAEPLDVIGRRREVAVLRRNWAESSQGYRPYTLILWYEEVPLDFNPDNHLGTIVQEGSLSTPRILCFPIQVNLNLLDDDGGVVDYQLLTNLLAWLSRRWAIESLFERFKTRLGRGQSRKFLPWQAQYNIAYGILTSWHTWRVTKRRQYPGLPQSHLSLSWFQGDVLGALEAPERLGRRPKP